MTQQRIVIGSKLIAQLTERAPNDFYLEVNFDGSKSIDEVMSIIKNYLQELLKEI